MSPASKRLSGIPREPFVCHFCFRCISNTPNKIPHPGVSRWIHSEQGWKRGRTMTSKKNPRYKNGTLRRKHRARFKAMDAPCGICGGRLGPIHYDEPSDSKHPLSFVIDEIKPISKWERYGYTSAAAAAQDWDNLQAAHYCCNAAKGARTPEDSRVRQIQATTETSGNW